MMIDLDKLEDIVRRMSAEPPPACDQHTSHDDTCTRCETRYRCTIGVEAADWAFDRMMTSDVLLELIALAKKGR